MMKHFKFNDILHISLAFLIEYATDNATAMMNNITKAMIPKVLVSTVTVLMLAEF